MTADRWGGSFCNASKLSDLGPVGLTCQQLLTAQGSLPRAGALWLWHGRWESSIIADKWDGQPGECSLAFSRVRVYMKGLCLCPTIPVARPPSVVLTKSQRQNISGNWDLVPIIWQIFINIFFYLQNNPTRWWSLFWRWEHADQLDEHLKATQLGIRKAGIRHSSPQLPS